VTVTARGLRRSLLLLLARWLKAWAERLLAEEAPAEAGLAGEEMGEELEVPPRGGGPPAHWVERVRQGAPELLVGLELPRPARPRSPPDASRPAPGRAAETSPAAHSGSSPTRARQADPRPGAPTSERGAIPTPDGRRSTPPPPVATAPAAPAPAPPAPAPFTSLTAAGERDVPGARPPSPAAPARSGPHRVLRWSEHARRREPEPRPPRGLDPRAATAPGDEAPPELRQQARPEDGEPDWTLPPFQDPVPWPATAVTPREEPFSSAAHGRWPELLPEAPPGDQEEELVRRLERQRRIAREQRGD